MKWPTTTYFTCAAALCLVSIAGTACSATHSATQDGTSASEAADASIVAQDQTLNPAYFISDVLASPIVKEVRELANGTKTLCWVIRTYSEPHEHEMGPWAPSHITDGPDKGGIWIDNGGVFDVDGPFVRDIDQFYDDPNWKLYRDDGSIKVTDTKEAFMAAARPDVDPEYNNYVVEGRPEWIDRHVFEFVIPVKPIYQDEPTIIGGHQGDEEAGQPGARPGRPPARGEGRPPRPEGADGERPARPGPPDGDEGHGGQQINVLGLAFNGVNFEPPAPLADILAAYTLAPFDDAGGHINPYNGYHYHAVTGQTKEIAQPDGHAPMIGYIMDGYGLYAHENEDGSVPTDLDECGGHWDKVRGYHYHAGAAGSNQIIKAFRGVPGTMSSEE